MAYDPKSELAKLRAELNDLRKGQASDEARPAVRVKGQSPTGELLAAQPREGGSGFKNPREFLECVMKAYTTNRADKRLLPLSAAHIAKAQAEKGIVTKAAGSDEATGINDPYGGFLIPTEFSPDLLKISPEADFVTERVTKIPMGNPIVKIPARTDKDHTTSVSGGLTVTRRPETVAGTASRMQLEQVTLNAHTLFGLSYATEELLTDSPISFAAILAAGFSDQFTYHLMKERITGTGVGEFEGVLNSPAKVEVSKETGQAADTIVFENITNMRSRCWGYEKAIWMANHDCYPQLAALKLDVGTGGTAMYTPSLVEGRPDMLLGRPIFYTEYCDTIGDAGDIILVNWSEYLEGTYQPLQNEESIHVRFVNHERAFKFWTRNDARCWWLTAITPVNSSNTLSPIVTLAARA